MSTIDKAQVLANALKVSTPLPMWNSVVAWSEVWDLIKAKTGNAARRQGRQTEVSTQFGNPESIGSRFEDGNMPIADTPLFERQLIVWKKTVGVLEATFDAIDEAVDGPTAYANFNQLNILPLARSFAADLDRQAVGYGAGPLCRIAAAWTPGNNPIIIDRAFGLGSANSNGWIAGIRRGQRLVAGPSVDGSGLRNGGQAFRVLSLDPRGNSGSGTITVDGALPTELATGDYLWRGDQYGNNAPENGVEKEMMGLRGFLDDGTLVPVCQNIDRGVIAEFKGNLINATTDYSGTASPLFFMRLHDEARIYGQGKIDTILCSPAAFRNAYGSATGATYGPGYGAMVTPGGPTQVGTKGIVTNAFGAGPVNVRSVIQWIPGHVAALDSSTFVRFGMEMPEWDSHGDFWKPVTVGGVRKDAFYNIYRFRGQIACLDPRKNVMAYNVTEGA